jgi:hypothetical protein
MREPITLEEQAAYYAATYRKAIADLETLERNRDAAEGRNGATFSAGPVELWCARDAVKSQYRFIDKMKREADTHAMLLDLCKGAKR